ncbi:MAG: class I SAM-dependent methyltransferase [Candidatus Bipolaricaulis sp.]|nr:class I SAM-dependent methyltransferase [Candidatus Bipolaricaulis sp.]
MDERTPRLYSDLAWLWPLWGDPDGEYAEWCAHVVAMIEERAKRPVKTLLNLGCGGGKNAHNLKRHYAVTGLDLSSEMLANARKLNPECRFIQGDMRDFALPERFDAILIDDAVAYMTSQEDLSRLFRAAHRHLEPGGVVIVSPDGTKETFEQNETHVSRGNAAAEAEGEPKNVDVVFIENNYDPDPTDDTYDGLILYLIREDGKLRVEVDHHTLGIFAADVWPTLLREAGFAVFDDDWRPGSVKSYIGVKPPAACATGG